MFTGEQPWVFMGEHPSPYLYFPKWFPSESYYPCGGKPLPQGKGEIEEGHPWPIQTGEPGQAIRGTNSFDAGQVGESRLVSLP